MDRVVKEGTSSYHPLTITGKDGETVTPESMRYRLMDGRRTVFVGWTILPAATTEIEIGAEHNLVGPGGGGRVLTVEVTHNGGRKITNELRYALDDLIGL